MPFPYPTPHGWEAENARILGGCSAGRAQHPSRKSRKRTRIVYVPAFDKC